MEGVGSLGWGGTATNGIPSPFPTALFLLLTFEVVVSAPGPLLIPSRCLSGPLVSSLKGRDAQKSFMVLLGSQSSSTTGQAGRREAGPISDQLLINF